MSTLHTVNKSPFTNTGLQSCLDHCKDGDAVLMIEDGVYGALAETVMAERVAGRIGAVSLYVLSPDAAARGLAGERMLNGIAGVDYEGFVNLVADHDRTLAWL